MLLGEKMKKLIDKLWNRETILYLIFGVLTTVLNYGVFSVVNEQLPKGYALLANAVAFVAALVFAYVTNKLFVFESKSWRSSVLKKEIPAFTSARLLSFGFEEAGLLICEHLLHLDEKALFGFDGIKVAKIILNIIVVILNYVLSKFFIFKSPKTAIPSEDTVS